MVEAGELLALHFFLLFPKHFRVECFPVFEEMPEDTLQLDSLAPARSALRAFSFQSNSFRGFPSRSSVGHGRDRLGRSQARLPAAVEVAKVILRGVQTLRGQVQGGRRPALHVPRGRKGVRSIDILFASRGGIFGTQTIFCRMLESRPGASLARALPYGVNTQWQTAPPARRVRQMINAERLPRNEKHPLVGWAGLYPLAFAMAAAGNSRASLDLRSEVSGDQSRLGYTHNRPARLFRVVLKTDFA